MDNYLQYMRTLRSQMNDVEDQAAKMSVEEQMQITTIHTMEKDLESAKFETKRLKEDVEQMVKAKGEICSQILDRQKKISSLESDSSTITQTLELIQQERATLSAKLTEKRIYYTKVAEDINAKLQEQQEWINSQPLNSEAGEHGLVKVTIDDQTGEAESMALDVVTERNCSNKGYLLMDNLGDEARKNMAKLDSVKAQLGEIAQMKLKLVSENQQMRQSIEQASCKITDFKPELRAMDMDTLEEEHKALLSDKAGETEYLQSLHYQIEKLKGISHMIKCACGEEYKVDVGLRA